MKITKDQALGVGTQMVDHGMTEEAAIAWAASKGFTVTPHDAQRAAYERTRERNPFAAAVIAQEKPSVYQAGASLSAPVNEALTLAQARALSAPTVPTTALPAPAPAPTTPAAPGAAK